MLAKQAERLQIHRRRTSTGEGMILRTAAFRIAMMAYLRSLKQTVSSLLASGPGKCSL